MSNVTLVLGPVVFQDFEVPARIDFGGDQRVAVHELPGGARVIDTLGPVPHDIIWSGIFSGPDATLRARLLDTLRGQAAVLTLSWDVFFFNVIIRDFRAEYRNTAWVPYELRCSVLQDDAGSISSLADTLLSDVLGDGTLAASFAAVGGVALGTLQASLAAPNAGVAGTSGYLGAVDAVAGAQFTTGAGLDQAGDALAGYNTNLSGAAAVGAMIGSAGQAAGLAASSAFLGRTAANLANGSA